MFNVFQKYTNWLHTQYPGGSVEKLPQVNPNFSTNVPGLYINGDLTGIPLLKFSADSGARAVQTILAEKSFLSARKAQEGILDLVVVGGGVSGMAAALEAEKNDLDYQIIEASEPFSTIVNFPKGKPIFTYPTEMVPEGDLQFTATVKEPLVAELKAQTLHKGIKPRQARVEKILRKGKVLEVVIPGEESLLARRVIVAIGRSGNFRKLGVPGEDLDKVYNRLHDPKDFCDQNVLVVGGGDSALETAIALAQCGATVTISYRKNEFNRPKSENVDGLAALQSDPSANVGIETPVSERVTTASGAFMTEKENLGSITLMMGSEPKEIRESEAVIVDAAGTEQNIPNDAVFSMIGREPPLDFFRRSGVRIRGETSGIEWALIALFFFAMLFVYDWKNEGLISHYIPAMGAETSFPKNVPLVLASIGEWWQAKVDDRSSVIGALAVSMKSRSFYYTFVYTLIIGVFGYLRIRRRKTPYVTAQTSVLFAVQFIPLFLLPELILPWLGYNGWFSEGIGRSIGDSLFEMYIRESDYLAGVWPEWGHPRAYWRAYGFILAWPLMVYNIFTSAPMVVWIALGVAQTFIIIPVLVYLYGKGAYCGWICSCGGLAETLGDTQRHKMPHGPFWSRLNMLGQVLLGLAFVLLAIRILGWVFPQSWMNVSFGLLLDGKNANGATVNPLSWKWFVDVALGGVIGVGLYFKYSGRVWCRFACPLAALMHIYARFSRFRIFADKKKCISCSVCTSVCHQGIDVMNFANKGVPMNDPQCVRCSACVQSCPTGVLQFGRWRGIYGVHERLGASPVLMKEGATPDG